MGQLIDSSVHSSLVFEVNGKVVTDSLVIAKIFKKKSLRRFEGSSKTNCICR